MLGSDEKQLQATQAGTQEFYIGTLAPLSTRVKEVQVWDLPFLFQNEKEVYAVLDGASVKKIFEKIEPSGLVGLTWTGMGFRNLSNLSLIHIFNQSGSRRAGPSPLVGYRGLTAPRSCRRRHR